MNINMTLNKLKNFYKNNKADFYKIGLVEIIIMFTLLFFIYTMPIQVHRFSTSLFGRVLILLSIIYASYCNVMYGVTLALLFIVISELGKFEEGYESKIVSNMKNKYKRGKKKAEMIKEGLTTKLKTKAERFARKHEL